MSKQTKTRLLICALALGVLGASVAWAAGTGAIDLSWHVLSSGGAPAAAGAFSLRGTLGQTAVGGSSSPDGDVRLEAGYWSRRTQQGTEIYIPLVILEY